MPNYYAHLVFGRELIRRLPPALQGLLEGQREAFEVGSYGPDPLYFHRVFRGDLRRLGLEIHHSSFLPLARRLLEAVRLDLPESRGFAAGYICHFALDSRCHYYIEEQMAKKGLSHTGMEQELDRALMRTDGIDPLHETPMPPPPPKGEKFYETAASVHPGVTPYQYRRGVWNYRRASRIQTMAAGTSLTKLINGAGNHIRPLSPVRGSVLSARPEPEYVRTTGDLISHLVDEIDPTVEAVCRFFAAAFQDRNQTLDSWFDRPFIGQWAMDQAASVSAASSHPS